MLSSTGIGAELNEASCLYYSMRIRCVEVLMLIVRRTKKCEKPLVWFL